MPVCRPRRNHGVDSVIGVGTTLQCCAATRSLIRSSSCKKRFPFSSLRLTHSNGFATVVTPTRAELRSYVNLIGWPTRIHAIERVRTARKRHRFEDAQGRGGFETGWAAVPVSAHSLPFQLEIRRSRSAQIETVTPNITDIQRHRNRVGIARRTSWLRQDSSKRATRESRQRAMGNGRCASRSVLCRGVQRTIGTQIITKRKNEAETSL